MQNKFFLDVWKLSEAGIISQKKSDINCPFIAPESLDNRNKN